MGKIAFYKQPHWQDPRIPNPQGCNSSDGVAVYEDGGATCHACQTHLFPQKHKFNYYDFMEGRAGPKPTPQKSRESQRMEDQEAKRLFETEKRNYDAAMFKAFPDRNITVQTAQKFGVKTDARGHVYFPYYARDGELCGFKIRTPDKKFRIVGKVKGEDVLLFGQQLFKGGGKTVTIHEGEFDALAGFQIQDSKWAHVSIPTGAPSAEEPIRLNLDWLEGFENKVVAFDGDKPGQEAAHNVAPIFEPGTAKMLKYPEDRKDACEYLKVNMTGPWQTLFWNSQTYTPAGIVNLGEDFETLFEDAAMESFLYPWECLNAKTYGFRLKELVTLCSGSGMGWNQPLCTVRYISKLCEFGGSPIRNPEGNTELSFDIPNFPNYMITLSGNVWSRVRKRWLKTDVNSAGYLRVSLCKAGRIRRITIHKLMAYVFLRLSLEEKTLVVNHIDCDKQNNNISNLEVISRRENQLHAIRNDRQGVEENSTSSKITNETAHEICRKLHEGFSVASIVKLELPNVTKDIVADIKRGRTWKSIRNLYH